jgi:hypothetical protein
MLYLANLLVLVDSLVFSYIKLCYMQIEIVMLFLSDLDPLICFSFLSDFDQSSITTLHRTDVVRQTLLFVSLQEESIHSFTSKWMHRCQLCISLRFLLLGLRDCLVLLSWKGVEFLFFCVHWDDHVIFLSFILWMVYYTIGVLGFCLLVLLCCAVFCFELGCCYTAQAGLKLNNPSTSAS